MVVSVILAPLLTGIISYGHLMWQKQDVGPLASRLPMDGITGTFTCTDLISAVKDAVIANMPAINGATGSVLPEDVTVAVIEALPSVGAVVEVSVSVDLDASVGGLVPMPAGLTEVVSEATYRLDHVVVNPLETCR